MFLTPKPSNWDNLLLFQKVQVYMRYLNSYHARYVDKLEAKQIVKDYFGDEIEVAKLVRILESPDDLKQSDLVPGHIIKGTHGCGFNIFINEKTNLEESKRLLKSWDTVYRGGVEPQYRYIKPRFFIEERVIDKYIKGDVLNYKIRCIYGKATQCITVTLGGKKNFYDFNWKLLRTPEIHFKIPKPEELNRLIYLSEKLARPFEFVRIDFYIGKEGKIYFSEYTFSPSSGNRVFCNLIEKKLGASWTKEPPSYFIEYFTENEKKQTQNKQS